MSRQATPGWYTDPDFPLLQRYWDGSGWTSFTVPTPSVSESRVHLELIRARRVTARFHSALWGIAILVLVVVVMLRVDTLVN